jgi:hypothetical protein
MFPNREIGFDVGGQWLCRQLEFSRDLRGGFAGIAAPKAGDVSAGVRALQDLAKF